MVTPMRKIAFAICVLQAAARTWAPAGGFENSTGASGCVVKLIRQSLPNVCFGASPCEMVCPKGRGGNFDCEDHRSVSVTAGCQGLFQCSNGATTMCHSNGSSAQRCECTGRLEGQSSKGFALPSPCHLNPYTKAMGICPPAIPFPPMPPPSPSEPAPLPSLPSTHIPPVFDTTGVLLIRTPPPPLPLPSHPSLPHRPSRTRPSPRSPSHPPSPPCSGLPPSPTPPASSQKVERGGSSLHSVCSPACARAFHACVKANGAAGWVQCVNEFAHVVGALRDAGCVAGCEMPNAHGSGSASNTSARVEG